MMPNMIQPQKKMLPTDSTPTAATIVAVVTATLNAGAVPAMPMIADSKAPSASFPPSLSSLTNRPLDLG